jgi:hypothetical protein
MSKGIIAWRSAEISELRQLVTAQDKALAVNTNVIAAQCKSIDSLVRLSELNDEVRVRLLERNSELRKANKGLLAAVKGKRR